MATYALSAYSRQHLMNASFYNTAYPTKPSAWYVSLHTAEPDVTTGDSEITGNNYARVAITWEAITGTPVFKAENNGDIEFAAASADWAEATYFGIWDAISTGNFLGYGQLGTARTVLSGGVFRILDNDLDVNLI